MKWSAAHSTLYNAKAPDFFAVISSWNNFYLFVKIPHHTWQALLPPTNYVLVGRLPQNIRSSDVFYCDIFMKKFTDIFKGNLSISSWRNSPRFPEENSPRKFSEENSPRFWKEICRYFPQWKVYFIVDINVGNLQRLPLVVNHIHFLKLWD